MSYTSLVLSLINEICTIEDNEKLFSHIRAVLEIFILYSIETSDLTQISDNRASHLSRHIETLSFVGFQGPPLPPAVHQPSSIRHYLRISTHLRLHSRVEHCRAEIIQALMGLSETICLDGPLSMYNARDPRHQQNSATFRKRLRSTSYYWISIAYCLAVEPGEIYSTGQIWTSSGSRERLYTGISRWRRGKKTL